MLATTPQQTTPQKEGTHKACMCRPINNRREILSGQKKEENQGEEIEKSEDGRNRTTKTWWNKSH
jgi:hypothetical protein